MVRVVSIAYVLLPVTPLQKLLRKFAITNARRLRWCRIKVKAKMIADCGFDLTQSGFTGEELPSFEEGNLANIGMLYSSRRCDDSNLKGPFVCGGGEKLLRKAFWLEGYGLLRDFEEDKQDVTRS